MRKPALCIFENKAADQLSVTAHLISTFVFASTQICVGPGRKPRLFGKVDKYKLFKDHKRICVHTKIL